MATKQIDIPGIGPVTLYKRRGNRSLRLSITSTGEVRVSQPYWLPYSAGEQFVRTRGEWINTHRAPAQAVLTSKQAIGKAHHLHLIPSAAAAKVTNRVRGSDVDITYPFQLGADHPQVQRAARTAAIRALRQEAEQLLPQRLRQLAHTHGYSFHSVEVRHLKSRWGSCNSKQEITLNLFLMQLPWQLIDYVLLHELAHTRVMRHGPPFWKELEAHVANARGLRKEIARYSPSI